MKRRSVASPTSPIATSAEVLPASGTEGAVLCAFATPTERAAIVTTIEMFNSRFIGFDYVINWKKAKGVPESRLCDESEEVADFSAVSAWRPLNWNFWRRRF
jgi:hypothetical protein